MIKSIFSYFYILFCWLFIAPIGFLFPRKKGLTIVTGKEKGWLEGNTKYFFLEGIRRKEDVYFLTREKKLSQELPELKDHIILYPSFKAIKTLLRSSFFVVDHSHWSYYYPLYFFLSIKAHRIHLWHGLTFKAVELGLIHGTFSRLKARLFRRTIKYDTMISTSDFWTKHLYEKHFLSKKILNLGYPRNDVLFRAPDSLDLLKADENKYARLKQAKKAGYKVVIYAPTYRDKDRSDAFSEKHLDFESLNTFLQEKKIMLVLKFHPRNAATYSDMTNILNYEKLYDVYPIMALSDLLITDYSSIYIDYLVVDRPIIFFNYDYDDYLKENRALQSKFLDTIPGVITLDQKSLLESLDNHLFNHADPCKKQRAELQHLSYEYLDGKSSERIFNFMRNI